MLMGIVGRASNLILQDKKADIKKEMVHYDLSDNGGYLYSQYDSNNTTEYKRGVDVLHPEPARPRVTAVVKDIPFKVKTVCNCSNTGSSGVASTASSGNTLVITNASGTETLGEISGV